ncbi:hypothetical protein [Plantactinospora sp. KBS50]|uniref:hypothetical protein n=1 Tax=Plantactinospora sp. KBS50 TaxID=2024580 RepID=UPI0012FD850A|nr:hypothetical protein [Plantactinospora sp. KBS50]
MIAAEVHLSAQPRLDSVVTAFPVDPERPDARRLHTAYAGVAWIGDRPQGDTGLAGPDYRRRQVDARLFLPDTHWYDVEALADVEVQVTGALMQVAGTAQGTQGLVGALAEPIVEFYEHPEGQPGVGLCLWLRGDIWSNLGLSYRVVVSCAPDAVLEPGPVADEEGADLPELPSPGADGTGAA